MTPDPPPPMTSLLPETAPFTPEQRAWLNGFFAGLPRLDSGVDTAVAAERGAAADGVAPRHRTD